MTHKPLLTKPDWPEAQKRWLAFWDREPTDRPCMTVVAPRPNPDAVPPPAPETLEDRYFDPDYVAGTWVHQSQTVYYGGEAVPCCGFLMAGYALGCGAAAGFAPTTIWHPVTMPDIHAPFGWESGEDDPWARKLARLLDRLLDEADGRYLVTYAGQIPANDLLSVLRGPMDFLVDMADDLDLCVRRMEELFELWCRTYDYLRAVVDARQQAGTVRGWPGLWHPGRLMTSQSDMSCMVSAEMFDRFVMRDMEMTAERYGPVWYHVDGPDARRHVPRLLAAPYIVALQYVAGAGQPPNGPTYLDMYREIQAAGRCLDIDVPAEHLEFVIRHLRPEGLVIRAWTETPEKADELLDNAVRWAGTHAARSA